tara:strand:+ start:4714 stop:5709 length:996 start_codon:yes stop_codon:yes gene_type:complete
MATANYQLPTKLTFYPSYPLYAYASGVLRNPDTNIPDISDEDLYSLISLNPSKIKKLDVEGMDSFIKYQAYKDYKSDFFGVLGHDFYMSSQHIKLFLNNEMISGTPVVNGCLNFNGDYNGWSLEDVNDFDGTELFIKFNNVSTTNVGSFFWGSKFQCPQNLDLKMTYNVKYGYKNKTTIGGKTLSTLNYQKTDKWLLDAWELDDQVADTRNSPSTSRNGIREWSVSMSMLQDSKMMSQNNMLNNDNWTQDSGSEYSTGAGGSSDSLYTTDNSVDFYSLVIKMTMGGHLPCVVNISDSKNSDQWAIVRISDYSITQNNPKLVDIKMTLKEQV